MKGGYEKYVCDTYQHIYDRYDWNLETYDIGADDISNYMSHIGTPSLDLAYLTAKNNRKAFYVKDEKCKSCSYLAICDGLDTKDEVSPVSGSYLTNPIHFRKGMYKDYDSEIEKASSI